MSLNIDVKFNSKKVDQFLDKLDRGVLGVRETRKAFGGLMGTFTFRDVMDHFDQERGPRTRWKRWSDLYAERMRKKGKGGNRLLQDSGRLRQSFTPTKFRTAKGEITFFNPAKTRSGFPYAAHHDDGPSDGSNPRKFMWLSGRALEDMSKATLLFVMRGGI